MQCRASVCKTNVELLSVNADVCDFTHVSSVSASVWDVQMKRHIYDWWAEETPPALSDKSGQIVHSSWLIALKAQANPENSTKQKATETGPSIVICNMTSLNSVIHHTFLREGSVSNLNFCWGQYIIAHKIRLSSINKSYHEGGSRFHRNNSVPGGLKL